MANTLAVRKAEGECQGLFSELHALQKRIREKVSVYADGKNLKGNEIGGWLGVITGSFFSTADSSMTMRSTTLFQILQVS
jgi:hypothetical protein